MNKHQFLAGIAGVAFTLGVFAAETNPSQTFPVEVKVTGPNDEAVAGVGVVVEDYRTGDSPYNARPDDTPQLVERCVTGADGVAKFTATNETVFALLASKPGLSMGWTTGVANRESAEEPIELTLTSPTTVSGIVQDTAGKPVPEAEVWVSSALRLGKRSGNRQAWNSLPARLGRQHLATRTGTDGKFIISGLPADATLNLGVSKPGLALDEVPQTFMGPGGLKFNAGESNVVLTLNRAGVLEGRVVQEDTGKPIVGARVMLGVGWGTGDFQRSSTDSEGRFHLADLSAGEQTLRTFVGTNQFADWVCDNVSVTVESGATNRDIKITASRGSVLRIDVRDASRDQPIKGASISASRERMGYSARTSDSGVAWLRLMPGDYHLFVQKENYSGDQSQVTLEQGQTNQVQLTLQPAATLTGTVLDPQGKPAPKVLVSLFPFFQVQKKTDADGRFSLPSANQYGGFQQPQRVVVVRDISRNLAAAQELDEESTNSTLRLEPAVTLVGRVTAPNGKAIANAEVQVMFRTERMSSGLGQPFRADAQGRFQINALPPGRRYDVSVSARGFGRENQNVDTQESTNRQVELEPFQLAVADLRIAGVVVDADDKPVAGAWVNSYGDKQVNVNGRTDSKGRFAFNQVCAGPIHLSANHPSGGAYGNTTAEGGDTNITIQLGVQGGSFTSARRASRKISGTIVDPEGKPVPKVTVALFPNFSQANKQSDPEGRFTLSSDPNQFMGMPNQQRVLIARDLARNLATALDLEEEATNADLRLEPALTITGHVNDKQGKTITNAEAQAIFHSERMGSQLGSSTRVDAQGNFEIKGLPPGRQYSVNVSAKGFGQDNRRVDAAENQRRIELEPFELLLADQRVAGVVLDDDDKPISGARIFSYGDKQPNLNGQSDSKGRFSFDKVCAGPIQLSANSQRGSYGQVTAEGGDTNITIRLSTSPGMRPAGPHIASLKGQPLPDLAPLGLAPTDCPKEQPLLAVLIDAEQRPSRRALRLLAEQAPALKQKGVTVIVLQIGTMAEDAFTDWKKEATLPFPIGCFKSGPEKARAAWGAAALPWLILTDKNHRVAAEGFSPEELDSRIQALNK